MRSTFGFTLDDGEMAPIMKALGDAGRAISPETMAAVAVVLQDRIVRDVAIVAATGRWDGDAPLHADYMPGDVVGLRMRYAAPALAAVAAMTRLGTAAPPLDATDVLSGLPVAVALYEGGAYFLPVASAVGIMGSVPPEAADLERLRLPFSAVVVYFGADLAIPEPLLVWPEDLRDRLEDSRAMGSLITEELAEVEARRLTLGDSILADVADGGGYLCGVVLFADSAFRLTDVAGFLVAAEGDTAGPRGRFRSAIVGQLAQSTLAPLVYNVAAAVAWGRWHDPEGDLDLPPPVGSAQWRAAVRRGQFRRKEPRGVLAGVRVLDTARMFHPQQASARTTHASPVTHLRRGFWQRHRVGPRHDWHHEMRFHPPMLVNPGGELPRTTNVYRLPVPPSAG